MIPRHTVQKQIVSTIIFDAYDHPTAEEVYEVARDILPTISLGTVYRILKQLVSDKQIVELPREGAPSRFDGNVKPHAHFVCTKCGKYVDIAINLDTILSGICLDSDEQIEGASIVLKGLCSNCKEN